MTTLRHSFGGRGGEEWGERMGPSRSLENAYAQRTATYISLCDGVLPLREMHVHTRLISPTRCRILAFDPCAHMPAGVRSACRHANMFSVIFASLGVITNQDRQAISTPTIKM